MEFIFHIVHSVPWCLDQVPMYYMVLGTTWYLVPDQDSWHNPDPFWQSDPFPGEGGRQHLRLTISSTHTPTTSFLQSLFQFPTLSCGLTFPPIHPSLPLLLPIITPFTIHQSGTMSTTFPTYTLFTPLHPLLLLPPLLLLLRRGVNRHRKARSRSLANVSDARQTTAAGLTFNTSIRRKPSARSCGAN